MKKRLLAILLTLAMALSLMPMTALAAEDNSCGDGVTWSFNEKTGTLTISGNGAMADYSSSSEAPWFAEYKEAITAIVVNEGVTYIGTRTFNNLTACKGISLPATLCSINEKAFGNMAALEKITIADGNQNYKIEDEVLFTSDGTVLIKYPAKKSDASYTIPDGVEEIGYHAFSYASSLTSVTFPSSSLKTIGNYAFQNTGIATATIPDSVTDIGVAFCGSKSLKSITLGTGITELSGSAFWSDSSLETVTFAEGSKLKSIGTKAFLAVTSLKTINIPSTIETIANEAFNGCTSLTTVANEGVTFSSLTSIGEKAFFKCALTAFPITADTPITKIEASTFSDNSALKSIVIPDSVTEIGSNAFYTCSSLETVSISSESKLTSIGSNAFMSTAVEVLYLPAGITSIGQQAALHCNSLKVVDLSAVSGTITYGGSAFWSDKTNSPVNRIVYFSNSTAKETAAPTSYPKFNHTYSIYAVTNGGTFNTLPTSNDELATPTRVDYIFKGWYSDKDCTAGSEVTDETQLSTSSTYYAKWEKCTEHKFGDPTWSWTETDDGYSATATFTCEKCGHTEEKSATVTSVTTTPATCTAAGTMTYTAAVTFNNESYTGTKTVDIAATGHTPGEAVKENEVAATYTSNGSYDLVVYCTVCGAELSREKITVPKLTVPSVTVPTYTVSTPSVSNGTVSVTPKNAAKNTTVTITVTPDKDYELSSLTVTDANGNRVPVKQTGENKFTFTMPASKVTVNASFSKIVKELPFTDVSANDYFFDAVVWAVENGVTYGNTATTFGVGVTCNRADAVTFIWRAYGCPTPKTTVNPFTDISESAYYYDAVLWAVENGITVGTSATTFSPLESCRREHIVTFLYRAAGSPTVSHSSGFTDVADSAYYANAVTWAAENGITVGAGSATTFGPTQNCFREQIVTFLYRNLAE